MGHHAPVHNMYFQKRPVYWPRNLAMLGACGEFELLGKIEAADVSVVATFVAKSVYEGAHPGTLVFWVSTSSDRRLVASRLLCDRLDIVLDGTPRLKACELADYMSLSQHRAET